MRPGQTAPECIDSVTALDSMIESASMRPGQTAPECGRCRAASWWTCSGFNEAGADCPGMQVWKEEKKKNIENSFNEAGADCPGMRGAFRKGGHPHSRASMRPGQTAPECIDSVTALDSMIESASMRPGQTAPECGRCRAASWWTCSGFNEAGADCPGMQVWKEEKKKNIENSFNEAGADCPGMRV